MAAPITTLAPFISITELLGWLGSIHSEQGQINGGITALSYSNNKKLLLVKNFMMCDNFSPDLALSKLVHFRPKLQKTYLRRMHRNILVNPQFVLGITKLRLTMLSSHKLLTAS